LFLLNAKEAIAGASLELVRGCRSLMLDGSTTTLATTRKLQGTTGLIEETE